MSANSAADLQRIYAARFQDRVDYRRQVWRVLIDDFFQAHVRADARVLDLGCGYGEFINQVECREKHAMDLNAEAVRYLDDSVRFHCQDCSLPWDLSDGSLDVVFTSNFFEHLPNKEALGRTLDQVNRCLAPGGCLIALGPNIRYLPGTYWDFWDHHLPLTHLSLREALETRAFTMDHCIDRFLPYTMVGGPNYPLCFCGYTFAAGCSGGLLGSSFCLLRGKLTERMR